MAPLRVERLALTDFRNHAAALLEPGGARAVALTGPNGAGKTNVLEALSMLAPGRGLRAATLPEMARAGGPGGWAVAARLADGQNLGTGVEAGAPERRIVRVNGAAQPASALGERLAVVWLTPAMDRLLAEGASARRRFLDRLVLALEPGHGRHATRYEAAMRERTRLLTGERRPEPGWLAALEFAMAEHGAALAAARARMVGWLAPGLAAVGAPFPAARLALEDQSAALDLAGELRRRRAADAQAGRATLGPHRADLQVFEAASGAPAARASTGEQKALLVSVTLAHARLVADRRGAPPLLLMDEIAAHLDAARRDALLAVLPTLGQAWVTGTDPAPLAGLGPDTAWFAVQAGAVHRAPPPG